MADEATGGKKIVDEYEEFTARPDIDGKMKDFEDGVPDEVIEEGTVFEDNMTEFGKASGWYRKNVRRIMKLGTIRNKGGQSVSY